MPRGFASKKTMRKRRQKLAAHGTAVLAAGPGAKYGGAALYRSGARGEFLAQHGDYLGKGSPVVEHAARQRHYSRSVTKMNVGSVMHAVGGGLTRNIIVPGALMVGALVGVAHLGGAIRKRKQKKKKANSKKRA
jgi:hypothetical protein